MNRDLASLGITVRLLSATARRPSKRLVEAQYRLGSLYYHGQGVPKDLEQAAEWYTKAAEQGDTQAQADQGNMYVHGRRCAPGTAPRRVLA